MYSAIIYIHDVKCEAYNEYFNHLRYAESKGLRIEGFTSSVRMYQHIDGYQYIPMEELVNHDVDVLIVADYNYAPICRWAMKSRFLKIQHAIPIKVFGIPHFDLGQYMELLQNPVTLIANNCWGGFTYHYLGLPFASPFINMFIREDYLKLLSDLEGHMNCMPELVGWEYEENLKRNYPVCKLKDCIIHFNHYETYEEVCESWLQRRERMNWDNLFVMMCTDNRDMVDAFLKLDYKKSVCFVPASFSDYHDPRVMPVSVAVEEMLANTDFGILVNGLAKGTLADYRVLDLLLGSTEYRRLE